MAKKVILTSNTRPRKSEFRTSLKLGLCMKKSKSTELNSCLQPMPLLFKFKIFLLYPIAEFLLKLVNNFNLKISSQLN